MVDLLTGSSPRCCGLERSSARGRWQASQRTQLSRHRARPRALLQERGYGYALLVQMLPVVPPRHRVAVLCAHSHRCSWDCKNMTHFILESRHRNIFGGGWGSRKRQLLWRVCLALVGALGFPWASRPCPLASARPPHPTGLPTGAGEARVPRAAVSGGGAHADGLHHVRWLEVRAGEGPPGQERGTGGSGKRGCRPHGLPAALTARGSPDWVGRGPGAGGAGESFLGPLLPSLLSAVPVLVSPIPLSGRLFSLLLSGVRGEGGWTFWALPGLAPPPWPLPAPSMLARQLAAHAAVGSDAIAVGLLCGPPAPAPHP